MTDIEALRARMREAAEKAIAHVEMTTPITSGEPNPFSDFAALASPANVKALDAEIARLREDLDRVTRERDEALMRADPDLIEWASLVRESKARAEAAEAALSEKTAERDGAFLTSQQAAQSYSNLMRAKDDIDAQRQAAEAALAKRDEEVARLKGALWSGICALKEVERNTHYEFDGDYTPENERLIPRLCAAYEGEPNAE